MLVAILRHTDMSNICTGRLSEHVKAQGPPKNKGAWVCVFGREVLRAVAGI